MPTGDLPAWAKWVGGLIFAVGLVVGGTFSTFETQTAHQNDMTRMENKLDIILRYMITKSTVTIPPVLPDALILPPLPPRKAREDELLQYRHRDNFVEVRPRVHARVRVQASR